MKIFEVWETKNGRMTKKLFRGNLKECDKFMKENNEKYEGNLHMSFRI